MWVSEIEVSEEVLQEYFDKIKVINFINELLPIKRGHIGKVSDADALENKLADLEDRVKELERETLPVSKA